MAVPTPEIGRMQRKMAVPTPEIGRMQRSTYYWRHLPKSQISL